MSNVSKIDPELKSVTTATADARSEVSLESQERPKVGHDRLLKIREVFPSPENDMLYKPVDPQAPDIIDLAESIRKRGIMEPLVVTLDGYLLSGHRRHAAAKLAGLLEIPCQVEPINRTDDPDAFIVLLREFNRQRDKTLDEKLHEELVSVDAEEAYQSLIEHRTPKACVGGIEIVGVLKRKRISSARGPMLRAAITAINERRDFWPLSDRAVHYSLLNNPPLIHAKKPNSVYRNDKQSYKALTNLLTRARLEGRIPFDAIADTTRPVTIWDVHPDPRQFMSKELDQLLKGYARNLVQSQPCHLEVIGEKNTIAGVIRPIAAEYCIPVTLGRGFCSLPPRRDICKRYQLSGKSRLVLLIVSDFDPEGEEIAHSLARSMRDDFGVPDVHAVKVALTREQIDRYALPPQMKAKAGSSRFAKFTSRHGDDVYELEALPPAELQKILADAIQGVLDVELFNAEVDAEREDAVYLDALRRTAHKHLASITAEGK